jgi:hypothetical protein
MVLLIHFFILQVPFGSVLGRGYFGREDKYFRERSFLLSFFLSLFLCFDLLNFLMTSLNYAMQSCDRMGNKPVEQFMVLQSPNKSYSVLSFLCASQLPRIYDTHWSIALPSLYALDLTCFTITTYNLDCSRSLLLQMNLFGISIIFN